MNKIFVLVLNFNGGRDILECLESVGKEKAEILVVDNGSTDGSLQLIKASFPKVKIIENGRNLGFAAGNNVGIKYALGQGAEAALLLNQDTVVQKGFLGPLLENLADIVAPVIKFRRKGKWVYDLGGRVNFKLGKNYHQEVNRIGKLPKIDYVSGCAMLIRRPVFEKIGFLDEKFFLYFEDADFCLRAQKAGFKIAVEPKSIIIHKLDEKRHFNFFRAQRETRFPPKARFLLKSNFIFINHYVPLCWRPFAYLSWLVLLVKIILGRFR